MIHARDTSRLEHGMTVLELAIVIAVAGVLMVIGASALVRARMAGNEAAAIANLQSVNNAQFAYLSGCGRGYYATALNVLGASGSALGRGYISPDLATGPVVLADAETGRLGLVAGGKLARTHAARRLRERTELAQLSRRLAIDHLEIRTDRPYLPTLLAFFRERQKRFGR